VASVHLSCHERGWVFSSGPAGYSNWPIYVLAVVGPAGFVPSQDAFQQGTFLAPVQAIMTAADPVISIALGIAWLNVRLRSSPADIGGEVAAILLMITGIVITANYAPLVAGPGWVSPPPGAPAGSPGASAGLSHGSDGPRGAEP
jgi:hypothetical protein